MWFSFPAAMPLHPVLSWSLCSTASQHGKTRAYSGMTHQGEETLGTWWFIQHPVLSLHRQHDNHTPVRNQPGAPTTLLLQTSTDNTPGPARSFPHPSMAKSSQNLMSHLGCTIEALCCTYPLTLLFQQQKRNRETGLVLVHKTLNREDLSSLPMWTSRAKEAWPWQ